MITENNANFGIVFYVEDVYGLSKSKNRIPYGGKLWISWSKLIWFGSFEDDLSSHYLGLRYNIK